MKAKTGDILTCHPYADRLRHIVGIVLNESNVEKASSRSASKGCFTLPRVWDS